MWFSTQELAALGSEMPLLGSILPVFVAADVARSSGGLPQPGTLFGLH